jgi:2-dehydro-3-deoxyphosphooctonate aldolase (KDO 8-P synthase)
MPTSRIEIANGIAVGGDAPLLLIAGPDLIESESHALTMARALADIARSREVPLVFKASFDKANRTSVESERGPGLDEGLRILSRIKDETGLAITTDFHAPEQAEILAPVVDLLQVPAFLSRQTDMLLAAARTGRCVNVKKGQFLAPGDVEHIVGKLRSAGGERILITERGTTFGYHNLVVDFRTLARLRATGIPVCFDATHSVQLPGAADGRSGGEREFVASLARAAVAVGVDALFFEVHDDPDNALCDGPNQLWLDSFPEILDGLLELDRCSRPAP